MRTLLLILLLGLPIGGRHHGKGAGSQTLLQKPRIPAPPPPLPPNFTNKVARPSVVQPPPTHVTTNTLFGPTWFPLIDGASGLQVSWTNFNPSVSNFVYRSTDLKTWVLVHSEVATGGVWLASDVVPAAFYKTKGLIAH